MSAPDAPIVAPFDDGVAPANRRANHRLLLLLACATFATGFAGDLRALLLPQLQAGFHASVRAFGIASVPIGAGQLIAVFVVRHADHRGRRPMLLGSILGFVLTTLLSALSWNLWSFAAFQLLDQVAIGTQYTLSVVIALEELPPGRRGRLLSVVLVAAPAGVICTALLLAAGLARTPLGWRAFYFVALVPLALLPLCARELRARDLARTQAHAPHAAPRWRDLWEAHIRTRLLAIGAFSLLVKVPITGAAAWWVFYAERERHLSTGEVSIDLTIAFGIGMLGFLACGAAMDRFGRRITATAFLVSAAGATVALFQSVSATTNFVFLLAAVFFGLGVGPALNALGTEPFPTELRAQATAVVGTGLSNVGGLAGPAAIGILGDPHGLIGSIGTSVTALVPLMIVALPLIWRFVPEMHDARAGVQRPD